MTSFFTAVHQWVSVVFPPVGFVLNIVLFYLVWFRTPENMWTQNRLLLQTCALDFVFLITMTIGVPVPLANLEHMSFCAFRGYFIQKVSVLSSFDPGIEKKLFHIHVNVYTAIYYLDLFSVCIQSVYRYLCQNLNASLKLSHYVLLLGVAIGVDVTQQLMFASYANVIACNTLDNCPVPIRQATRNNDSLSETILMLTVKTNGFYQLLQFSWAVILISAYAIIFYCSREMFRFINGHANLNSNLKFLNRQLTYNFIIMAMLHFLLTSLNVLAAALVAITNEPLIYLKYVIATLISSLPVLNPIVCILVNPPYRNLFSRALYVVEPNNAV